MSIYANLCPELICSVLSFLPGAPDLQLSPRLAIRPLHAIAHNKHNFKVVIKHLDVLFKKHQIAAIPTPNNAWLQRSIHFHSQSIECLYMMFPSSPRLSHKLDHWIEHLYHVLEN